MCIVQRLNILQKRVRIGGGNSWWIYKNVFENLKYSHEFAPGQHFCLFHSQRPNFIDGCQLFFGRDLCGLIQFPVHCIIISSIVSQPDKLSLLMRVLMVVGQNMFRRHFKHLLLGHRDWLNTGYEHWMVVGIKIGHASKDANIVPTPAYGLI